MKFLLLASGQFMLQIALTSSVNERMGSSETAQLLPIELTVPWHGVNRNHLEAYLLNS